MEKKYQVFVSSTYEDLKEERQEIIQALLELDAIPVGMELFPAANDSQWELIKKAIDGCDYYLVVLAGRYGSIGPQGISYTEMEYRYALQIGKPILGFIRENCEELPSERKEQDSHINKKLDSFRNLILTKMCQMWKSPKELSAKVSRSFVKLMNDYPSAGWVRGASIPKESSDQQSSAPATTPMRYHCPLCDRETNCNIIAQDDRLEYQDEHLICCMSYLFLKCCGCDVPFFVEKYTDLVDWDHDRHGKPIYSVNTEIYPRPKSKKYRHHKMNNEIKSSLRKSYFEENFLSLIYQQTSDALNEGKTLLVALGVECQHVVHPPLSFEAGGFLPRAV